jgi:hypothetical protein
MWEKRHRGNEQYKLFKYNTTAPNWRGVVIDGSRNRWAEVGYSAISIPNVHNPLVQDRGDDCGYESEGTGYCSKAFFLTRIRSRPPLPARTAAA